MRPTVIAAALVLGAVATVARADELTAEKLFDELAHDFGTVAQGTELHHRFKVTNSYKFPLKITDVRVSMSPVDAEVKQTCLQPGESAYIEVRLDTARFVGRKTVPVYVTIGGNGGFCEVTLRVTANSQEK
jgi:hypothetical protein